MTREMYVCSTPHETKVALVEDDQLSELFFERENEYTLAGSIYKGRVTRVLPGMQSAFVDVGLERDAFLYVSDFLEFPEDEDSEFGEIAVSRPETFVSSRPPQEQPRFEIKAVSAEAHEEPAEPETGGFQSNTQPSAEPETSEGEEEERGYRGNRRRRRARRGRGFPESKYARPGTREEHDETPEGATQSYERVLLPGESISKYQTREEEGAGQTQGERIDAGVGQPRFIIESEVEAQAETLREPEAEETPAEPPARESRRGFQGYQAPIVLPGESIAKYHGRQEVSAPEEAPENVTRVDAPAASVEETSAEAPAFTEGAPVEDRVAEAPAAAETPQSVSRPEPAPPATGGFVVLPGESIAKYRGRNKTKAEPVAHETPAAKAEPEFLSEARVEATETLSRYQATRAAEDEEKLAGQAASFVIESEPWSETLEKQSAAPVEQPGEFEIPTRQDIVRPAAAEQPEGDPGAGEVESSGAVPEADEERTRLERMNLASIFGGDAIETEEMEEDEDSGSHAPENAGSALAGTAASNLDDRHPSRFGAPGAGTLEHEEIEGEEDEPHSPKEEEIDSNELELEEESFDAAGGDGQSKRPEPPEWNSDSVPGEQLVEALEEHDILRSRMSPGFETEAEEPEVEGEEHGDFDEDLSFEEEELAAGGLELPEEQQEEAIATGGRAETRGAGSGHQRQERREHHFDRQRGRRGGRRVMRRHEAPRPQVQISDLLKEGQEILVQIAKEPIGKKGARITSHIALPGRFLVYMPTVTHVGVSRKITSDEERQRLKRIMISEREGGHGGFIVRTAAAGVGEDELRADIRFLKNLWAQIKQRAENGKAPALIYHDLNLVERILRDLVTADFSQVWVDNELEYERILNFANRFQPSLVRRIKLYTKETPLFEQFGIHEEINKALKSKVWLKSGGYIVINQTEALVAIDINTGKYVGKTARLEDTIVKTNIDAIREIVRQIRLRDLGGIIVIDFIDMDERKNRQKVMQALEEALKADRSPSKVLAFNDFGLVAITRKRVKQSLERTLGSPCPYCTGNGFVKSVPTVCNEIYTELRKMRRELEENDVVHLRVNPEIAKGLKGNGGKWLQEFEELVGRNVIVKPDPLLHQEQFDIH